MYIGLSKVVNFNSKLYKSIILQAKFFSDLSATFIRDSSIFFFKEMFLHKFFLPVVTKISKILVFSNF